MAEVNWKDNCWVTTIYLVHDKKVLLTWNKRLQTWIPMGGHIEPGETPEEAIKREVAEESGFEFEFIPSPFKESARVLKPARIQIEDILGHSEHINIIWIGRITKLTERQETDEQEKLRWFTEDELRTTEMFESVKTVALEALKSI